MMITIDSNLPPLSPQLLSVGRPVSCVILFAISYACVSQFQSPFAAASTLLAQPSQEAASAAAASASISAAVGAVPSLNLDRGHAPSTASAAGVSALRAATSQPLPVPSALSLLSQ